MEDRTNLTYCNAVSKTAIVKSWAVFSFKLLKKCKTSGL